MGYGLDGRDSIPARDKKFFSTPMSRQALGPTQPPIQYVPGAFSLCVKRPEREADHSSPASVKVKKGIVVPPLSHIILIFFT
jgi:hypothetical protein